MIRPIHHARATILALAVLAFAGRPASAAGALFDETKATTLFAFDSVSIPFTRSLLMELNRPEKFAGNPVVARGARSEPDHWGVQFYGSIIRVDGKFRLWYCALDGARGEQAEANPSFWRLAYAESDDGIRWVKPKLGLVEYRGTRDNNLLPIEPVLGPINVKVLHEPDDPDPTRRYKMMGHIYWMKGKVRHGTPVPFASADGLRWRALIPVTPDNAQIPASQIIVPPMHFEPAGGLFKWDGMYYASGQSPYHVTRPTHARIVRQIRSRDFIEWSATTNFAFARPEQFQLGKTGNDGKQSHEGVSVWHRGNVLVGLYGLWQGAQTWPGVTIDLGLVVSNDGLHFREPITDLAFIPIGPDGTWDQGGLMQGQGFENVGDKSLFYYGAADPRTWTAGDRPIPARGGVGLATLPRDRIGHLRVRDYGEGAAEFVTTSLAGRDGLRLYVNASGLGAGSALRFELLTHDERPLPGHSGNDAAVVHAGGFQAPIVWRNGPALRGLPARYRVKATFEGERREDIRFSALYIR
ncbi:MAG: hypothetical protein JNL39_04030 [Opitutaceae bacterium]|nr:hypothetical protein [Opitutaceae bacterium]